MSPQMTNRLRFVFVGSVGSIGLRFFEGMSSLPPSILLICAEGKSFPGDHSGKIQVRITEGAEYERRYVGLPFTCMLHGLTVGCPPPMGSLGQRIRLLRVF